MGRTLKAAGNLPSNSPKLRTINEMNKKKIKMTKYL